MPTDVLTAARDRLATVGLADELLAALAAGSGRPHDRRLTDDNAATVWQAVSLRLRAHEGGRHVRRADVGLVDLHGRLQGLLREVHEAADVDMPVLLGRYRAIRAAQQALTMAAAGSTGEIEFPDLSLRIPVVLLLRSAGAISNIDEVWPSWRDYSRGNSYDSPPWEHPANQPHHLAETAANLRWLADGPAHPWVPTLKQAAQAFSEQTRVEEARRMATTAKRSPYN